MTACGSVSAESGVAAPFRFADGVLTLYLHVQPGAARTGWAGRHGDGALKLRLAAPPVDGKANRACVQWLASAAGVPRSSVRLIRGERSRDKVVQISPLDKVQFRELQRQWEE